MIFTFDFTEAGPQGLGGTVAAGAYHVTCTRCEYRDTRNGNPAVFLTFQVNDEGPFKGAPLTSTILIPSPERSEGYNNANTAKMRAFIRAFNPDIYKKLENKSGTARLNTEWFEGKTGLIWYEPSDGTDGDYPEFRYLTPEQYARIRSGYNPNIKGRVQPTQSADSNDDVLNLDDGDNGAGEMVLEDNSNASIDDLLGL